MLPERPSIGNPIELRLVWIPLKKGASKAKAVTAVLTHEPGFVGRNASNLRISGATSDAKRTGRPSRRRNKRQNERLRNVWRPTSPWRGTMTGTGSAYRPTWNGHSAATWNAASSPTGSPALVAPIAVMTSWSHSPARGGGCARRATPAAWRKPRRIWSITSSRPCRCEKRGRYPFCAKMCENGVKS